MMMMMELEPVCDLLVPNDKSVTRFNAKLEKDDIFKPIIGYESPHQDSNDNGIRIANFATSENLVINNMMVPH